MAYTFFLSYAVQDDLDGLVTRFFGDLRDEVRMQTGLKLDDTGFFDKVRLNVLEDWSRPIERAITTCRTSVCLFSPSYFANEHCGREFQMFLTRSKIASPPAPSILPINWIQMITPMPDTVRAIQWHDANLPNEYADSGLRYLMRRRARSSGYVRLIDYFAKLIAERSVKSPLPEMPGQADFQNTPSAWVADSSSHLVVQQTVQDPPRHRLKVFLCHSSADKPAIRNLYGRLLADGFDPWLDTEKLIGGTKWQAEIKRAVRASEVVLVCISATSITKEGFVQKEIGYAIDIAEEKPDDVIFLIPVRLEECAVPDRLHDWQWVDLFSVQGYEKLQQALRIRAATLH